MLPSSKVPFGTIFSFSIHGALGRDFLVSGFLHVSTLNGTRTMCKKDFDFLSEFGHLSHLRAFYVFSKYFKFHSAFIHYMLNFTPRILSIRTIIFLEVSVYALYQRSVKTSQIPCILSNVKFRSVNSWYSDVHTISFRPFFLSVMFHSVFTAWAPK